MAVGIGHVMVVEAEDIVEDSIIVERLSMHGVEEEETIVSLSFINDDEADMLSDDF